MKINRGDEDEKSGEKENQESFIVFLILFMAILILSSQVKPLQSINVSSYPAQNKRA